MGDLCPWCGQHIDPMRKVWVFNESDDIADAQFYHFGCGLHRQHAMKSPHVTFQGHAYEEVAAGRWRRLCV
jgi:hypothetical protein